VTACLALDTGPLVALLVRSDRHHRWATEALRVRSRVVSCEAVLSEASFLVQKSQVASAALRGLMGSGEIELVSMANELPALAQLMGRYSNVPMSFADACMVRMSEVNSKTVIATIDSDFRVYRRNGRQVLPVLTP
jgi:predicted nucleic acid-binding protein